MNKNIPCLYKGKVEKLSFQSSRSECNCKEINKQVSSILNPYRYKKNRETGRNVIEYKFLYIPF